jgi:hypothetical protein
MGRKSFNKACKTMRITFEDPWQDGEDGDDNENGENSEDSENNEDSEADDADPPFDNGRRGHWDGNLARPINSMRQPSETRNRAYFLRRCLDHELTVAEVGHRHFEICCRRELEPITGRRWQEAMEALIEDINRAIFGMARDRFLEFWIAIRLPILAYELAQLTTTQVFFQFGRTMVEARGASVRRVLRLLWQQYDDVTTPQLREQPEPDMPQLSSSHKDTSSRPTSAISSQNTPSSRPGSGIASSPPCQAGHALTRLLS